MAAAANKPLLVGIGGPTASGKTPVAIELARHFKTEIISFDARQFYREMNIGTAVPTKEELALVPHHFIRDRSVEKPLSAGRYAEAALKLLNDLFKSHDVVIAVGGSGLYWHALATGLNEMPEIPEEIRASLQADFQNHGIEPLQEELQAKDPQYSGQVDIQNPMRVIRALEVIRATGNTYSEYRDQPMPDRPFGTLLLGIDWQREVLYERINQRVDQMVEAGLEEEAKTLYPLRHLTSLNTVGYKEWFEYFDNKCSREEAIADIKQHSRNYAKRQLTWFRREQTEWFSPEDVPKGMVDWVEEALLS